MAQVKPTIKTDSRSLIIGMGEIGTALYKVLSDSKQVMARDLEGDNDYGVVDVMHICFPYSDGFVEQVKNYIEQYNPSITIVYSTVQVGTCKQISPGVVHSPVEGIHPRLDEGIRIFPRWLGSFDETALYEAAAFWKSVIKTVRIIHTSEATEFMKLRSTARYGVNLVFADYEAKVAKQIKLDYEAIKDFDRDYNYLYFQMGKPEYQRYVLDPPNGEIGGHCVTPNAELLDEQFPHPMLKLIKKMRKK